MDLPRGCRSLAVTFLALLLMTSPRSDAAPPRYSTVKISSLGGGTMGLFPKGNNRGEVVWSGNYYDSPGLHLYSGGTVSQLSTNPNISGFDINNAGQVVWSENTGMGYNLFRRAGGATVQLTTDGKNNFEPALNDHGDIVWNSYNGATASIKRYTAAGGAIETVWSIGAPLGDINTMNTYPMINDLGHVAWMNYTMDNKIRFYLHDGTAQIIHTCDGFSRIYSWFESLQSLNHRGDVILSASDGIWLKPRGAAIQRLATQHANGYRPRINDNGWAVYVDSNTTVYLYGDGHTRKIADIGRCPQINSQGHVLWADMQGIYVHDQTSGRRVAAYGNGGNLRPAFNDLGQAAWQGNYSRDGAFLSSPTDGPTVIAPVVQLLMEN